MKIMNRRVFLAGGALAPAAWGAAWDKKPFEKWSNDDVRRVLTDSPWAKSMEISLYLDRRPRRGVERWIDEPVAGTKTQPPGVAPDYGQGSPVGGIGAGKPKVPTDAVLTVMWASAMPVKQAVVRSKFSGEAAGSDQAREILERYETDYVVEVYGIPALVAYGGVGLVQDTVYQSAFLKTRTGKKIPPGSVHISVRAAKLVITMRFPKTQPITEKDGWVEVFGKGEVFEFRRRFSVKPMKYRGQLEL